MNIRSRLHKLENQALIRHRPTGKMVDVSPDQAEKIYNQVMNGPSPPLFARTRYGTVPFNELSDAESGRIYKEYASGNLDTITEKEV